jgi:hypothetical protein
MRNVVLRSLLVMMGTGWGEVPDPAPRATSGDGRVEPAWDERLTVRVGIGDGEIRGSSEVAIQGAIDLVARRGGGTVEILPGTYRLRNSVFLASGVRLTGHGAGTVLVKESSVSAALTEDSDWYDQEITLSGAEGFRVGDGICLRAPSARYVIKRTLVARSGNRFRLDRALRDNLWTGEGKAVAETLYPLISGEGIESFVVEKLTLDGNRERNGMLDGNYAGCVWLQDCRDGVLRELDARNYHGDGLSWQVCHDMTVERCVSRGHSGLGLHPGSGSQRSRIVGCRLEGNDMGIFFCWGVRGGVAEGNVIRGNRVGISMGHRDTDNLVKGNEISGSLETGLLFRGEKDAGAAAHRNVIEGNQFLDNGPEGGAAVTVAAAVQGIVLRGNQFRESRGGGRQAVKITDEASQLEAAGNEFHGMESGGIVNP